MDQGGEVDGFIEFSIFFNDSGWCKWIRGVRYMSEKWQNIRGGEADGFTAAGAERFFGIINFLPVFQASFPYLRFCVRHYSFNDIFGYIRDQEEKTQISTLCAAAKVGNLSSLVWLLKSNANLHMCDHGRNNALHIAADSGYLEMVRTLVEAKADINAQNCDLNAPLLLALWKKHEEVAMYLVRNSASIFLKSTCF